MSVQAKNGKTIKQVVISYGNETANITMKTCIDLNIKRCHSCKDPPYGAKRSSSDVCIIKDIAANLKTLTIKNVKYFTISYLQSITILSSDPIWFIEAFKQVYPEHVDMLNKLMVLL